MAMVYLRNHCNIFEVDRSIHSKNKQYLYHRSDALTTELYLRYLVLNLKLVCTLLNYRVLGTRTTAIFFQMFIVSMHL